ncbi:MAG: hypothetical protein ABJZ92_23320, partial [Cyclobacteriaceae bacterium]
MKKIYLSMAAMLFAMVGFGQIFSESFETDGNGTRYSTTPAEFSDGSGDFLTRTDGSNISGVYAVTGADGTYYFAAQDIDGEGDAAPHYLNITGIDISGESGTMIFSILLAEDDSSDGNEDWDAADFFLIEYQIDGGGYTNLLAVEADISSGSNGAPLIDTDFDGLGDGSELTPSFAPFSANIEATGNVLDIRFTFSLDSGDEDIAIDNISLTSSSAPIVAFDSEASEVVEPETQSTITVPVTLSNFSSQVDLGVSVTGGTADMADYSLNTTSLSFTSDGTQNVSLDLSSDADLIDETIELTIVETTSTGINISVAVHTITVTDSDATSCGSPEFFTSNVTLNTQGDTWYETSPGDYEVNGFTGGSDDFSEVWLIYGPLDMSSTSIALLQFDIAEGYDGGTDSDIEVFYTGSYTGNPGDAGNSWTSAGTFLGAGDDDATGAVADISAASGTETFIGIKYTAEGSGGGSSSIVLSNIALLADVCPTSGVITWTGATDSDWSNSANWDGGVPTNSDYVVVAITDNDPTISGDATALELKVLENEAVTVTSGGALAIMGSFSGEGEVIVERNTTGSGGYSAIGSPLDNAELDDISADYLYSFDEATNMFVEETTGDMTPGVGYFAGYDASSPVISLTGVPNTGVVTTNITMDDAGYNLVANPYAAPISMAEFRIGNDDIDDVIYLWDDGGSNNGGLRGGDYVTVSDVGAVSTMDLSDGVTGGQGETAAMAGNIASFQGFFVKSLTGGGTVSFEPTMQTTASGANADANYYREAGEKQLVRLAISGNDLYNEILIGLTDNATLSFDNGLDAFKLSGNELISFYSILESEKLAIQALPKVSTEEMNIQLGFDLAEAGEYELKLAALEGISDNISVLVYDKVTGQTHDLKESASIAFTNSASVMASKRFSLVLAPAAVLGFENAKSNFNVFTNESG